MIQITAGNVMDRSSILLNDSLKTYWSYIVLLPYLQVAYDELREELESNNVQATNAVSPIVQIMATMIDWGGNTGPALPADMISIQGLYERLSGSAEDFQEMTRVEFLPTYTQKVEALVYWTWQNQAIQFLGATQNRDVVMHYIADKAPQLLDQNAVIPLFNAKSFLAYRCAALASSFAGESSERATELNQYAQAALDRLIGINTKDRQTQTTRRRPFLARYKVRGY